MKLLAVQRRDKIKALLLEKETITVNEGDGQKRSGCIGDRGIFR